MVHEKIITNTAILNGKYENLVQNELIRVKLTTPVKKKKWQLHFFFNVSTTSVWLKSYDRAPLLPA